MIGVSMNINLELYKVFYFVAIELSFSKAASKLFISQSAISQSILSLERELNTKLFTRTTKKVTLTQEGETLFRHIEPAIHSIEQGEKQLREIAALGRGRLHIGVSDTICKYYLIPYLQSFHESYPNIDILITNQTSIECVHLLKKNKVDLIVTNLPNHEINDSLDVIETKSFRDIVIAPSSYTGLFDKRVSFETLNTYPVLLLDKQSSTTQFLQESFRKLGLSLKPAIELGSIDLLVEMTSIGLGITFVPDYVYRSNKQIHIVKTKETLESRKLGIVTHAKTPLSNASQAFIKLIKLNS
jgi:DNA-binding transcriptional LysR family regulator